MLAIQQIYINKNYNYLSLHLAKQLYSNITQSFHLYISPNNNVKLNKMYNIIRRNPNN
jgi:hypothetical protein